MDNTVHRTHPRTKRWNSIWFNFGTRQSVSSMELGNSNRESSSWGKKEKKKWEVRAADIELTCRFHSVKWMLKESGNNAWHSKSPCICRAFDALLVWQQVTGHCTFLPWEHCVATGEQMLNVLLIHSHYTSDIHSKQMSTRHIGPTTA